jgi:homeodomain-containing protein
VLATESLSINRIVIWLRVRDTFHSAEFGISRKTGYKIFDRYKDCGVQAFSDRSHRAHRQANRLPASIEATIVRLKREYPGWGAPKIREKLRQQVTGPHLPAISTVHAVLDRHHLVRHRRRRRPRAPGTELSRPTQPNALWCADYKGESLLGNRQYCYPPTITDFVSRYLLTCEALSTTQEKFAFTVFERTFKEFGLPRGFGPTTACRSRPPMRSTASANSQSGGSVSGSRSSASSPAIRNRMAGMSGCI